MRTLTLYAARIAAALLPLLPVPTLTISPSGPSSCDGTSKPGVAGASESPTEWDVEVMLGDGELMLLAVLMLVMDSEGGQDRFGPSATWVGDEPRDESVSVRTGTEDREKEAQSWTDDLSL